MNARTESPEVLTAADPLDTTALVPVANAALEITEVLDALPKDEKGKTITSIAPIKFEVTDTLLATLKHDLTGATFDVKSTDGMKAAKATVSKLTALKTGIEKAFTEWNKPVRALQKKAGEQRDYAIEQIVALREPIAAQVDAEQAIIDAKKAEAAVAESRRIEAHVGALTLLQNLPGEYVAASVADIEAVIRDLSSFDYLTRRDWEEYMPAAQDAQRAGIDALGVHLTNAKAREELAAIRAQQQKEADARAAAEAAAEAERQRVANLRERIQNIQLSPTTAIGTNAAQIQKTLDRLNKVDANDFAELTDEATAAITSARTNLLTMLEAAKDAEELAEFRAAKARKTAEEAAQAEDLARREREAAEEAARLEREAKELAARQAADEAAAREAAREAAAALMREKASTMRDLLVRACDFIVPTTVGGAELLADIEALLNETAGE
jgi:hypothetical protein